MSWWRTSDLLLRTGCCSCALLLIPFYLFISNSQCTVYSTNSSPMHLETLLGRQASDTAAKFQSARMKWFIFGDKGISTSPTPRPMPSHCQDWTYPKRPRKRPFLIKTQTATPKRGYLMIFFMLQMTYLKDNESQTHSHLGCTIWRVLEPS